MSADPASPSPGSLAWLRHRLFPRGERLLSWAGFVIVISNLIIFVIDPTPPRNSSQYILTILFLSLLLVLNIVWDDIQTYYHNRPWVTWALLCTSLALMLLSLWSGSLISTVYILFMLAAQATLMLPLRQGLGFTAAASLSYLGLAYLLFPTNFSLGNLALPMLIGLVFTLIVTMLMNRNEQQTERTRQLLAELQIVNAELLAARQKEKELAIAEERVRMAREIHDGLGHHLTALSIQLQAAQKALDSNPQVVAEAISMARGETQAALSEVRQSVAAMRQAPVNASNLTESIQALSTEFSRRSGLTVQVSQQGNPTDLSPAASLTLYRAVQESLTNIQKHAQGVSKIEIHLLFEPDQSTLTVTNNGSPTQPATTPGFGLAGIAERVSQLGGTMTSGQLPDGGFKMHVILPRIQQVSA